MWSFGLRDAIQQIYSRSGYPKYTPNTVLPEYSCAMHAKYDIMRRSIAVSNSKEGLLSANFPFYQDCCESNWLSNGTTPITLTYSKHGVSFNSESQLGLTITFLPDVPDIPHPVH